MCFSFAHQLGLRDEDAASRGAPAAAADDANAHAAAAHQAQRVEVGRGQADPGVEHRTARRSHLWFCSRGRKKKTECPVLASVSAVKFLAETTRTPTVVVHNSNVRPPTSGLALLPPQRVCMYCCVRTGTAFSFSLSIGSFLTRASAYRWCCRRRRRRVLGLLP